MLKENSYRVGMERHRPTQDPTQKPPRETAPNLPTADDVDSLAIALDRDGFDPHEDAVAELVALARQVEPDFASLGVLVDRSAPEVVRSRSFGALAGRWASHRQVLQQRRDRFEASFDELRSAWLAHDRARSSESGFDELWRSRTALDRLRVEVARRRRDAFGDGSRAHLGA
jgi:hypothetical protein